MDSCKGTRKVFKQISDHRQTAACKAQAVAVGTQNKLTDLRLGPFNTALQKRFSDRDGYSSPYLSDKRAFTRKR